MYHYTECGLQNVWLKNGYKEHKTPYGKGVSIEDVQGLHDEIGRGIAMRPRLTGAELRFLRKELGLTQGALARLLGISEQNVSLWERHGKIPKWGARWTKVLYLGKLDGHVQIEAMIEALISQDESNDDEKLKFENNHGWKAAT